MKKRIFKMEGFLAGPYASVMESANGTLKKGRRNLAGKIGLLYSGPGSAPGVIMGDMRKSVMHGSLPLQSGRTPFLMQETAPSDYLSDIQLKKQDN
jgi:hypothetical protein